MFTRTNNFFTFSHGGFLPSRCRVCPICGKPGRYHCSLTKDGSLAICKYVWSEKRARDGRWIHVLRRSTSPERASAFLDQKSQQYEMDRRRVEALADADRCDAVYRHMLGSCLLLTPEHGDALLERRGLSDTTIAARLYASAPMPEDTDKVCDELTSRFSVKGVPGFFRQGGRWRLNIHKYNSPGVLVPVCDTLGRIVGIQIRRDSDEGPRYVWLSSASKPEGVTSGAPIHFSKPDLARRTGRLIITEGPLKADVCAEILDACIVGIAGVDAFPSEFGVTLRRQLPEILEVIIAYDADWHAKAKRAILRLCYSLRNVPLRVRMWDWDLDDGKGLDDYLLTRSEVGEAN